ncbi:tripartite tricarboxylate transporter substrate binding protein [Curvibacter sp. RS43]|uniref:Bug family tripartite tricarboxylate transporter substrate binding protein n=1 Tax=Curvibacter microcysteis TaxID=3026419 RepID=UPI002361645E|nr:tripartite tricarboxylate transporter substrate binding protein [Curvibacter sp. RS43]MDD0812576.1 tripartite tricarboxylate transporter substrate binding protein [Curvibacter sp. RS43]
MKQATGLWRAALALFLSCGAAAAPAWAAEAYPSKPIRMIIPFPPGGTLDALGRQLAQKLSEQMGQAVIVDNRPGGNGVIGAQAVAKAAPDGHTVLFNASTFTTAPMTMKQVPYSVTRDFAPVALVAKAPLSVAINKNLPVTDLKSLIAYSKKSAQPLTFAVGSVGSAGHLATELLRRSSGLNYAVVPYKGTAPAFQDLVGGQIDGFIDPILGSLQYHRSGLVRVVAVTSTARASSLAEVPVAADAVPGYEFYSWYGLWVPAQVAAEHRQRLNREINKALGSDMKDWLSQQGLISGGGDTEVFERFQREEMRKAQTIIDEGQIRVE